MYYYILDSHDIPQKDFEKSQTELQSLLTEFRISGEIARVTPLRVIPELVDTAATRGATTLVACGTDETFYQVLAAIKDHQFTLAFIPFSNNSHLGRILGMTDLYTCVKTIAGRRIERIDAATIDGSYFISSIELGIAKHTNQKLSLFSSMRLLSGATSHIKLRIDDSYNIESDISGALLVNTRGAKSAEETVIGNPGDGTLELLILGKVSGLSAAKYKDLIAAGQYELIPGSSVILCQKVEFLEPVGYQVSIGGKETARFPVIAEVAPGRLKMIVGKNRTF
jgi:diacylglycerol kinase family enzyme